MLRFGATQIHKPKQDRYQQVSALPSKKNKGWRGTKVNLVACAGECGRSFHPDNLVFINHCYHDEPAKYKHKRCAGMRRLCRDCHLVMGTHEYYESELSKMAQANPDQYPWGDCLIGLRLYLPKLEMLVKQGVNPANENDLRIAW